MPDILTEARALLAAQAEFWGTDEISVDHTSGTGWQTTRTLSAAAPRLVRALVAEVERLQAGSGSTWQPIATAPLDLSVLVARVGDSDSVGVARQTPAGYWWGEESQYVNDPPTQWMPLPDPPQE
jgi:hypothetical protein